MRNAGGWREDDPAGVVTIHGLPHRILQSVIHGRLPAPGSLSLNEVFRELQAAQLAGLTERYAIGGAVAATVYIEAADTEDVDVFVTLKPSKGSSLVTLEPLNSFFKRRGATAEGEQLAIGGWLVQLLPPPTSLVEEALDAADLLEIEGVRVPVFSREHVAAVALEVGRLKDKVRLQQLVESAGFDRSRFTEIIGRHRLSSKWARAREFFKEHG